MLAAAAPDPRFAELRAGIERFCAGEAACVASQKDGVRHFLGITALFSPPQPVQNRCLSGATRDRMPDWVTASDCLRAWSKTQPSPFPAPGRR